MGYLSLSPPPICGGYSPERQRRFLRAQPGGGPYPAGPFSADRVLNLSLRMFG